MNDYCVRIKSHPVWAIIRSFRRKQSQAISQWMIKSAEQIGGMNTQEINKAIWQVIWRTIINGIIVLVVVSLAIYSGYLTYQFPDPQHLNFLLLFGAVSCNILLTQLLNFKYFKTILLFVLSIGSLITIARIVPCFDRMLMYVYTSWLLIFILPIIYGLIVMAFDLARFRNTLIAIAITVSTFFYLLYPIEQFFNWEMDIDLLSIANRISFITSLICLVIFMVFGAIAKLLQSLPQVSILVLRSIASKSFSLIIK
jgi:hypothetical protein